MSCSRDLLTAALLTVHFEEYSLAVNKYEGYLASEFSQQQPQVNFLDKTNVFPLSKIDQSWSPWLRFLNPVGSQPLGKNLSFLEDPRTFEGTGRTRGLERFRKAHLENILPRGS